MTFNRAEAIDQQFIAFCRNPDVAPPDRPIGPDDSVRTGSSLTGRKLLDLFEAQLTCRHLDLRRMPIHRC